MVLLTVGCNICTKESDMHGNYKQGRNVYKIKRIDACRATIRFYYYTNVNKPALFSRFRMRPPKKQESPSFNKSIRI